MYIESAAKIKLTAAKQNIFGYVAADGKCYVSAVSFTKAVTLMPFNKAKACCESMRVSKFLDNTVSGSLIVPLLNLACPESIDGLFNELENTCNYFKRDESWSVIGELRDQIAEASFDAPHIEAEDDILQVQPGLSMLPEYVQQNSADEILLEEKEQKKVAISHQRPPVQIVEANITDVFADVKSHAAAYEKKRSARINPGAGKVEVVKPKRKYTRRVKIESTGETEMRSAECSDPSRKVMRLVDTSQSIIDKTLRQSAMMIMNGGFGELLALSADSVDAEKVRSSIQSTVQQLNRLVGEPCATN